MAFEKVEYAFPGNKDDIQVDIEPNKQELLTNPEKENKLEQKEFEIEIVEDTPKKDLNKYGKPIKKSDPPSDVTDEELDEYSDKVQKRIKHLSKGYHDERREKERVVRERQELEAYTQRLIEENKSLKTDNGKSKKALLQQAKTALENEILLAKRAYKTAYEEGDSDNIISAQEKLTAAKIKVDRLGDIEKRNRTLQEDENSVKPSINTNVSNVDPKAKEWASRNTWFNSDLEMTGFAKGVHQKLVSDGVDPSSDEYYEKIDARMQELFPDRFENTVDIEETQETEVKRQPNVVAPATRSTSPLKVKLKRSQIALAKRLGVPLDEYARHEAALKTRRE